MKLRNLVSSALISSVVAFPAFAQEALSTVVFASGENGGALPVAQGFYGRSQAMETAIIDINDDGAAEIAVKFEESCGADGCEYALLYFGQDQWLQAWKGKGDKLGLSRTDSDMKDIVSSDHVRWSWTGTAYHPLVNTGDRIWEIGTPATSLSRSEASNIYVQGLITPEKRLIDLNADGAEESVVYSTDYLDCTGYGDCPFFVFDSSGKLIESFSALEGDVFVDDGVLLSQRERSVLSLAYSGEGQMQKRSFQVTPVTGR